MLSHNTGMHLPFRAPLLAQTTLECKHKSQGASDGGEGNFACGYNTQVPALFVTLSATIHYVNTSVTAIICNFKTHHLNLGVKNY